MEISHSIQDNIIVIQLAGRFDANGVAPVKRIFRELLDKDFLYYVFNFSGVDFVDSSGLGCLISCIHTLKPRKGNIKVAEMQSKVKSVFELIQLHKVFESYDKVQTAIDSYKK